MQFKDPGNGSAKALADLFKHPTYKITRRVMVVQAEQKNFQRK